AQRLSHPAGAVFGAVLNRSELDPAALIPDSKYRYAVPSSNREETSHGSRIGPGKQSIPGSYLGGRQQAERCRRLDLRYEDRGPRGRAANCAHVPPMGKSQIPRRCSETGGKLAPDAARAPTESASFGGRQT